MAKAKTKSKGRARGRKRLEGVRHKSGDLKRLPAKERAENYYLTAHKLQETNSTDMPITPLGILAGRGLITQGQYYAAGKFQSTYRAFWAQHDAVRKQQPQGLLSRTPSGPGDEDAAMAEERQRRADDPHAGEKLKSRYEYYERTLKDLMTGDRAWHLVQEIVIFGETCGWQRLGWLGFQIKQADLIRVSAGPEDRTGRVIARNKESVALPTTIAQISTIQFALGAIGGDAEDERLRAILEQAARQDADDAARLARMAARAAAERKPSRRATPPQGASQAHLNALVAAQ